VRHWRAATRGASAARGAAADHHANAGYSRGMSTGYGAFGEFNPQNYGFSFGLSVFAAALHAGSRHRTRSRRRARPRTGRGARPARRG
jgi:hypothetical protein